MNRKAKELIARYPYQFQGERIIGYEFYPGWMDALEVACAQIDQVLRADKRGFHWVQIKEKFGTARFYYAFADEERTPLRMDILGGPAAGRYVVKPKDPDALEQRIFEIARDAERKTTRQCMVCGALAIQKRYDGWVGTLCERHPPRYDERGLRVFGEES